MRLKKDLGGYLFFVQTKPNGRVQFERLQLYVGPRPFSPNAGEMGPVLLAPRLGLAPRQVLGDYLHRVVAHLDVGDRSQRSCRAWDLRICRGGGSAKLQFCRQKCVLTNPL